MSKEAMKNFGEYIGKRLPKDIGFCVLVFPFKQPGVSNYISNAQSEDMIKALREAADKLEKNQVFETPDNNIY